MTNYDNGANFERRVKKLYEDDGWFCVRSAGSHGPADLICIKSMGEYSGRTNVLLLQMKTPKGWKDRKEVLKKVAKAHNVGAVYVWRESKPPYKIHEETLN